MTPREQAAAIARWWEWEAPPDCEQELVARIEAAILAEREACANIADGCTMGRSALGPLHGMGWTSAAKAIAEGIRARSKGEGVTT